MKQITIILSAVAVFFVIYSCNYTSNKTAADKQTAQTYCGSCHLFPDASLLNKAAWLQDVLPPMGKMLGISYGNGQAFVDINYQKDSTNHDVVSLAGITMEQWNSIVAYYQSNAPDSMPSQGRAPVEKINTQFEVRDLPLPANGFCATAYTKIDQGNHWFYIGNTFDSSLSIYNEKLVKVSSQNMHAAIVDIDFRQDLLQPGERSGIFTNIGIMNPNDKHVGSANAFTITQTGTISNDKKVFDSLPRPVQITQADFNGDGRADELVCGFGNKAGALYIMYNKGDGKFERYDLRTLPGAIKAYITDFDHDGKPDILALMTQALEGIFFFKNKGDGNFETQEIMRFPPIYGSSYFELDDFNKDGHPDILYTCGDNADYTSRTLKPYHGVYIYLNDGSNHFKQSFFYPIHGCFKAIARDFDKDGDLDIATISFFPDSKHQPTEGFIYLENKGSDHYEASTINEVTQGKWLTMDAADINGDGYDDILIGSLVPPVRSEVDKAKKETQKKSRCLLLLKTTQKSN